MRVSIPDDVAEALQERLTGRQTLESVIDQRLRATLHAAEETPVVLSRTQLNEIAAALGTDLPIASAKELLRQCTGVGQLHLHSTRLQFTPPQLSLIKARADKVGDTIERFVARIAAKLMTEHFQVAPASEGVFYLPEPLDWESEPEDSDSEPAHRL